MHSKTENSQPLFVLFCMHFSSCPPNNLLVLAGNEGMTLINHPTVFFLFFCFFVRGTKPGFIPTHSLPIAPASLSRNSEPWRAGRVFRLVFKRGQSTSTVSTSTPPPPQTAPPCASCAEEALAPLLKLAASCVVAPCSELFLFFFFGVTGGLVGEVGGVKEASSWVRRVFLPGRV